MKLIELLNLIEDTAHVGLKQPDQQEEYLIQEASQGEIKFYLHSSCMFKSDLAICSKAD